MYATVQIAAIVRDLRTGSVRSDRLTVNLAWADDVLYARIVEAVFGRSASIVPDREDRHHTGTLTVPCAEPRRVRVDFDIAH